MPTDTTDQIASAIAEVMLDLPSFGELIEIRKKDGGFVPFGWDRWHAEQRLFEENRTGRDLVVKPRQIGFSTLELARDVQYALTHSGVQVLVVVHMTDEKAKLFAAVRHMVTALVRLGLVPKPKYSTKTEVVFEHNGSAIYVTEAGSTETAAEKRGRSGTVHRLHATEAAFWGSPEATWTALMGACEHGDEIVIESTARGIGNWFHERVLAAKRGEFAGFKLHFFPWFAFADRVDDPALYKAPPTKRAAEWAEVHRKLGVSARQMAWWWRKVEEAGLDATLQEYPPTLEAAFRAREDSWIEQEYLDALTARTREPIALKDFVIDGKSVGSLRIYEAPRDRHGYVIGGDVAEGIGRDRSTMTVLRHRTAEVVASYHSDSIEAGDFGILMTEVGRFYNTAWIAPERENDGKATVSAIVRAKKPYPRLYRDRETGKAGWSTNGTTRPVMWSELRRDIEKGLATTPDADTAAEAASIVRDKQGRPAARGKGTDGGAKDDLFVSWAIARQVRALVSVETKDPVRPAGKPTVSSTFRT